MTVFKSASASLLVLLSAASGIASAAPCGQVRSASDVRLIAPATTLPPMEVPGENRWREGAMNKMNWGPDALHALPWRSRNVTVARDRSVELTADRDGEAGIVSGSTWDGGTIEYAATFPATIPPGTDVASGYLYSKANGDELNFPEVLSDGRPRFAVHAGGKQVVKVLDVDVRGSRRTFAARWKADDFVTFTMDGAEVWTLTSKELPVELDRLPTACMAFVSSVAFLPGLPAWAGPYTPLEPGQKVRLMLHGFRSTPF